MAQDRRGLARFAYTILAGLVAMFVCPGARGRGLGGTLVDAVVGWAREREPPVSLSG
jgi:GNAT superfamily N-acetyltransferase